MKKLFAAVGMTLLLLTVLNISCRAAGGDEEKRVTVTEYLTGERRANESREERLFDGFLSSLPEEISDMLPDGALSPDPLDVGQKFDVSFFAGLIVRSVRSFVSSAAAPAGVLLSLVVISFILRSLSSDAPHSSAVNGVIHAAVCVAASGSGLICVRAVSEHLEALNIVSASSVPVCISMLVSVGRVTSSGVSAAFISGVSALCERIYSSVVLPLASSSLALSFAESVFISKSYMSLSSFMRKTAVSVCVGAGSVSSFIFGVQSILSGAADTAGMKTVKFALGSFVPFVGSAVGDTVSAAYAGASAVKNIFGAVLLVIVFSITLKALTAVIGGKVALWLAGILAGVLGGEREVRLFSDLSGVLNCLLAAVVSSSAVFAVIVGAFISYGAVV